MVIWNVLEDLRRRENAQPRLRRGEDAAALRRRRSTRPRATARTTRENMFLSPARHGGRDAVRAEADELPRPHARSSARAALSYRDLPFRFAESSTLHRDEPPGTLHGLLRVRTSPRTTRTSSAPHEQIEDEIFGCLDYASYLYDLLRAARRGSSSRRGPRRSSAPTRSGTSPRARSAPRSSGAGSSTS